MGIAMISIEDLITALNAVFSKDITEDQLPNVGHFVVQRFKTDHAVFKVYKQYEIKLWYVNADHRQVVLSYTGTIKSSTEEELEQGIKDIEITFIAQLLDFHKSNLYNHLLHQ